MDCRRRCIDDNAGGVRRRLRFREPVLPRGHRARQYRPQREPRTDAGIEIAWTPSNTASGEDIRTTFIVGVARFRPWASKGFSIKGGMGMALGRNWVYDFSGGIQPRPSRQKHSVSRIPPAGPSGTRNV